MTTCKLVLSYQALSDCRACNRLDKAEATVVQKLNPTSFPKTRCTSFSDRLFWYFFGEAKKYKQFFEPKFTLMLYCSIT